MFLLYRNQGKRHYGLHPIAPYPRRVWEFQIIMSGRCSMVIRENDVTKEECMLGPVLIITGPECAHGWSGRPKDVCNVMVFHFDEADFLLRSLVGQRGYRWARFSSLEFSILQSLYDRCDEVRKTVGTSPPEAKKRAGFFAPRIYGIVAMELTLLFLKHIPKIELGSIQNFSEMKVAEALAWYEYNLGGSPNISDVAQAVHLSPTHLRRLFHKIRGASPRKLFKNIQFERVKWLMRDPAMTLERIAENSGFGSGSAFSRAFTLEFGMTPKAYRTGNMGRITE